MIRQREMNSGLYRWLVMPSEIPHSLNFILLNYLQATSEELFVAQWCSNFNFLTDKAS